MLGFGFLLSALAFPPLSLLGPPEAELPALDPVIAAAARWAVAIQVEREEEPAPARRSRRPSGPSSPRTLPPDLVDYYRRPPGLATGMILDRRGHVLTSYYNVSGKVKGIEVVLPGGHIRPARVLATDPSDDLALLEMKDPPPDLELAEVKWAEPGGLQVGTMVVALGRSPDPDRPTATFGIISALGRNGGRAFQTDAELNYGNVGGPIADLDGSVVGLAAFISHTGRYSIWGLNSGIGFGTSAQTIRAVLPRLLSGENVPPPEYPLLGVGPPESPQAIGQGVPIGRVEPGSAAAQGGLRAGDVVLLFGGEKVDDFLELRRQINRRRPGDEVTLRVRRENQEIDLQVRLGKRGE